MANMVRVLKAICFAIVCMVLTGFILAIPVMLLWNSCLVGAVAGVSVITWMKAWGLSVLGLLFRWSITGK